MIIRILGDGQYEVGDDRIDDLNVLDDEVQKAVESGDAETYGAALAALLATVRELGFPLAADAIVSSALVLPAADLGLQEVRALLSDEGLIPG
ncbi:hypothetical protein [Lentzea sp. HUAS12]|uniref:PspA-associated protein PspAA n=1 Tax=Lentzea sp. HUAS12 TaxID=2951806 RepID=UPI0020A031D3|nr:hypothetical protein [Lentzea sp. HUAS12]USX53964.1 hypothetical protein ND450_07640 [Lentzea sp. HUAS12]